MDKPTRDPYGMRFALLFIGHVILSCAFALIAMKIGPGVPQPRADRIVGISLVVELVAAGIIVWLSRRTWNIAFAFFLGLAVTAWGFCCSFVAAMGLTGTWL